MYIQWFGSQQVKWDWPDWEEKPLACNDGTVCGVNAAVQMLSYADCNTLDMFAESAALHMLRSKVVGYKGGFTCVVFDHDQAYRRVQRLWRFHCLILVGSPRGSVVVGSENWHVPPGGVVYLSGDATTACLVRRARLLPISWLLAPLPWLFARP